eukprot:s4143_g3.t1
MNALPGVAEQHLAVQFSAETGAASKGSRDVEEEPNSRPATKNLQSMLRPIMTPMQPQRSPRYVSKKFGWQDFSSTTTSFATATSYPSSYGTDALGASSMSGFGRGDAMAQTFSEGFGAQGAGRPKKKRRVQDGKSRRGKARAAWQSPDRSDRKSMGRQMNESFTSSQVAW